MPESGSGERVVSRSAPLLKALFAFDGADSSLRGVFD
jgi:hypothetical protein